MPAGAIAAIEHLSGAPSRLGNHPGAILVISSWAERQMSISEIIAPASHATSAAATIAATVHVVVVGLVGRVRRLHRCRRRRGAPEQRQQDQQRGERLATVRKHHIDGDYDP